MVGDLASRVQLSLNAGIVYLRRLQHPAGSWTDFWLPVGTSDAWVTAYVGIAMLAAAAKEAPHDFDPAGYGVECARRAGEWLLDQRRLLRGWGYNGHVPPDADSTAHALSLIARLGLPAPADAVSYLEEQLIAGQGFRTYHWPGHPWGEPCADVTAAGLRALYDLGRLDPLGLRDAWQHLLAPRQDRSGLWRGYWWLTPNYTTGMVMDVWNSAGRPRLSRFPEELKADSSAFDLAWGLYTETVLGRLAHAAALAEQLAAQQEPDGGWPAAFILRVTDEEGVTFARDARRTFVTATAVRSLAALSAALPGHPQKLGGPLPDRSRQEKNQPDHRRRAALGVQLDHLMNQAASAVGFPPVQAACAADLFTQLTQDSLAEPSPWPAAQISSLAGGVPLEFSVAVGNRTGPGLRYAAEVGNPLLPPYQRASSAVAAIRDVAERLGYREAWRHVSGAVDALVSPGLPVSDGTRFWVWSGIDQEPGHAPILKTYLNLFHDGVGGAWSRLEQALDRASIPITREFLAIRDRLDSEGFLHELGFGLSPAGIACKVYWELPGWRRAMVRELLGHVGLPHDVASLCPEIPGILLESFASKRRAGIALRLDPHDGGVLDVTTAAAFPPQMIPAAEFRQRVILWLSALGWDPQAYWSLSDLLLQQRASAWRDPGQLHSLFTRTVSASGEWVTIYLRPCIRPHRDDWSSNLPTGSNMTGEKVGARVSPLRNEVFELAKIRARLQRRGPNQNSSISIMAE